MKKNYFLLLIGLTSFGVWAQNVQDALLYSNESLNGTARYQSMSGAFGALGGDLSAINVNPAGGAVFKTSQVTGSLSNGNINNDANYFSTLTNTSNSYLAINQAGGVYVLDNTNESAKWKKLVFGLNYQQTQNFNQDYFIAGSSNNSISSYFLAYANGLPLEDIQILQGELIEDAYLNIASAYGYDNQQAFLGYYGGVIDPVDENDPLNTLYNAAGIMNNGRVNQEYFYSSTGNSSKFNFNFSGQYENDWYFGMNLNLHSIFTEKNTRIIEDGYDATSDLEFVVFDNYLRTTGVGGSLQAGVIRKFDKLRLGLAYQSPTWYRIEEEQSQRINSNRADAEIGYINGNQITLFEPYRLRTPSTLTGSAALVIGKQGLISFDYNYKDFNNIKMRPTNDFVQVNSLISDSLKATSSFRLGGEYRYNEWSFRGGYRFEETPYKDDSIVGDLKSFSLGLGYNFGRTKFDVSFVESEQKIGHQLYEVGLTNLAAIDQKQHNITATISHSF